MTLLVIPTELEAGLNKGYWGCPWVCCQAAPFPRPQPNSCASAFHRLLPSSNSGHRRWPKHPHFLCQHQSVLDPCPRLPEPPQSSCPPAGPAGASSCFWLPAVASSLSPGRRREAAARQRNPRHEQVKYDLRPDCVTTERDLKLPPQADCSSQWRIPMWASWQSHASISRRGSTCKWEVHFPCFFNHYMPGLLLIKPWGSSDFHRAVWESYQQKQRQNF